MEKSRVLFLALVKKNQTYYYLLSVPADLSGFFPTCEIKKSLKTKDLDTAKVLAASYNTLFRHTTHVRKASVPLDISREDIYSFTKEYGSKPYKHKGELTWRPHVLT